MRLWMFRAVVIVVAVVVLAVTGCGCEDGFRCETGIAPDGQVSRAIYQPEDKTPAAARDPKRWQRVTHAATPQALDRQGWPSSLSRFPAQCKNENHPYFVASGKFHSVAEVPDHLVMPPPEGADVPAGRLERKYTRTDFGFFVEHRWKETLTDCVTFDDMRRARGELVDLLAEAGRAGFEETVGKDYDYDAAGLVTWLKTEGKDWLAEVTDTLFVAYTGRRREAEAKAWEEVARICESHGLVLKERGKFLEGEALGNRLDEFADELMRTHLKRKDGRPLGRKEVDALRRVAGVHQQGEAQQKFEAAGRAVLERKFGGKKALERRMSTLIARVGGLYVARLFDTGRFDYRLTVPGEVVESNGQILAANRVRWQFEGREAYPIGFTMECRSLAPEPEAMKLLSGAPLADRDAMLAFAALVEGHEGLLAVLRECRRQKTLKPLVEHRKTLYADPKASGDTAALFAVYKALGIRLK
jgi:hypothetical protein